MIIQVIVVSKKQWKFGYAPPETEEENKVALTTLRQYVCSTDASPEVYIPDQISIVKGMFNRILRRDRKDWATVNILFGNPEPEEIKKIVAILPDLRKALLQNNKTEAHRKKDLLKKTKFLIYAKNYLTGESHTRKQQHEKSVSEHEIHPKINCKTENAQAKEMALIEHETPILPLNEADPVTIWIYNGQNPCRSHPKWDTPISVPSISCLLFLPNKVVLPLIFWQKAVLMTISFKKRSFKCQGRDPKLHCLPPI